MPISNVIQKGATIQIYDENGRQSAFVNGSDKAGEGLKGYTSTTVNVQRGTTIYTYDEKGRLLRSTGA